MRYKVLYSLLSKIMLIEAVAMTVSMLVGQLYGESPLPFLYTIAILIALAIPGLLINTKKESLYPKDGLVCVSASWVLMSLFGALPFMFSGVLPNFIDAFFETVSGFTTTGSSVLTAVEGLPKGILFWRSFTHWMGGMGVLMLMLAIMPDENNTTIHLLRAEVPGPTKGKIVPKMKQTSLILYGIYFALSVLMTVALLFTGMPLYDSVVNAFATAGTGGFSVLNNSIAGYNNPAAEWVIAIFMFIFGVNFNIYYFVLIGKLKDAFKSEELKAYTIITALAVTAIILNNLSIYDSIGECIRDAAFQVTTISSTTGYSTANFDLWPAFSKTVLFILMFIGACAGSTAGGLKVSRIILIFKNIGKEVKHLIRPKSVNLIKIDGEVQKEETIRSAAGYLSTYFLIFLASILVVSLDGFDAETNITAVTTCLNNVGPGFGNIVGPIGNFSSLSYLSKLVLSFDMLLGRLEIMPMLVLFVPSVWKRR